MNRENPDLELCVIGCLLDVQDGTKLLRQYADQLQLDFFWRPECRKAVEILLTREREGKTTDTVLFANEWQARFKSLPPADLLNCPDMVIDAQGSLGAYISELIERQQVEGAKGMVSKLVTHSNNIPLKAAEFKAELDAIFSIADLKPYQSYDSKAALLAMTNDLERRFDLKGKASGVVTGFRRLDAMLDGIQYAELTVCGARPSHGKTALALQVAQVAAIYQEIPTLFVTMEMSVPALMRRLLSATHSIPMSDLKRGQLTQEHFDAMKQFGLAVRKKPLYFLDCIRGIKASALTRQIKRYCEDYGVKLVIGDYLQKTKPDSRHEKRTYEVAAVSEAMKASAVDTGAATFWLAQMSREPEKDEKQRPPRLSDLADSAQIERDADAVLLLQREKKSNRAVIVIGKQRDGCCGTIDFTFEGEYVRFIENHETP